MSLVCVYISSVCVCLSLRLSQTAINSRHVQSAMLVPGWSQSEPITKVNWTPGCASLKLHNLELQNSTMAGWWFETS